jgi:hypothetical protein
MTKKNVTEDTKTQFEVTVNNKVNKADKPAEIDTDKVPGQARTVLNKTAVTRPSDSLPNYATTSKDGSKTSKVAMQGGPERAELSCDLVPGQSKGVVPEEDLRSHLLNKIMEAFDKRAKKDVAESKTVDMSEHINALFEGTDLSEEFKAKTAAIFETAVNVEVEAIVEQLVDASLDTIEEEHNAIVESYDSKIEEVIAYVAEQWLEQNQVALQAALKAELTEDFIKGLHKLCTEHYITLPEDKVDVAEALAERVAALEDQLDEQIQTNIDLKSSIVEAAKSQVVKQVAEGLTDVDSARFATLCESTDANNIDDFEAKIKVLRESYFSGKKPGGKVPTELETPRVLTEEEVNKEAKEIAEGKKPDARLPIVAEAVDPRTAAYTKALKRFAGK